MLFHQMGGRKDRGPLRAAKLQPKFNQICTYEYIVFSYVCTVIRQKELPDGRAERRGVPELQTKLDQLCLYEYVVFRIYLTFVKQKIKARAPSGRSPLPFWVRA